MNGAGVGFVCVELVGFGRLVVALVALGSVVLCAGAFAFEGLIPTEEPDKIPEVLKYQLF